MTEHGFKKELGLLDLTMSSLGGIIGSGWLFGALYAANVAGPAAVISWIIGGFAVLVIAFTYAELGAMLPEAGAIVRYPHLSHGHLTGFIAGWAAWIAWASVPALEAEGVMQYASHWLPVLWNSKTSLLTGWGLLAATVLIFVFFIINYMGVRFFAQVNTTVTFVKFIMPLATIIIFLLVGMHWGNLTQAGGFAPGGSSGVLTAIATTGVIFAYTGFRQSLALAAEARNPQRDIPRSIIISLIITIILYVFLQLVFIVGVSPTDLVKGWSKVTFNAPFAELAASLNLGWFAMLLYADAILSPAGTGNVYMASTSRIIYALGKNKYFPKVLAKVNPRNGIPVLALFVAFVLGLIFLLPFPSWQSLVGLVSSATIFTYILGPVSMAVFRKTVPEGRRPFRLAWAGVINPAAFVIGSLIVYWTGWNIDSKLLIAILIGVVLYLFFAWVMPEQIQRPNGQSIKSGMWMVFYLIAMLIVSYLGSSQLGGFKNIIPYPWDMVVVIVVATAFYYWGVASGYHTPDIDEVFAEHANTNYR
ncbi:APC family permease [Alicyclobacillaceae bacterium I2511]|nr:APC family permease [Alicyclobacillaceae bacterium I2511]